jgi:hypothetical protein
MPPSAASCSQSQRVQAHAFVQPVAFKGETPVGLEHSPDCGEILGALFVLLTAKQPKLTSLSDFRGCDPSAHRIAC